MAATNALNPKSTVTYMLPVALTGAQVMTLEATKEELSGTATYLLQELARGGMMLDAGTVQSIASTAGEVTRPSDILRAVENANHRDAGRLKASIYLDPMDETYYRNLAASRGEDVQHLIQDEIDYIREKGWLGNELPADVTIRMSINQRAELEEMLGLDHLTGQDIYDFIAEHATAPTIEPLKPVEVKK